MVESPPSFSRYILPHPPCGLSTSSLSGTWDWDSVGDHDTDQYSFMLPVILASYYGEKELGWSSWELGAVQLNTVQLCYVGCVGTQISQEIKCSHMLCWIYSNHSSQRCLWNMNTA